eukprot:10101049-Alexandrium_andersonii.AAC.1
MEPTPGPKLGPNTLGQEKTGEPTNRAWHAPPQALFYPTPPNPPKVRQWRAGRVSPATAARRPPTPGTHLHAHGGLRRGCLSKGSVLL